MRLEQLQYLLEIQKHHSMNIAANNIHVSQQAISISLKKLEQELSVKLIDGTAKGTMLTPEGELVAQAAFDIFERLTLLDEQLQQAKQQPTPPSLTFLLHPGMIRDPDLLPQLYASFSDYKVNAFVSQFHDMIPLLQQKPNYIGLTYLSKENLNELTAVGLNYESLGKYRFGAYLSLASPFAALPVVSIYDLVDAYPIMSFHEYLSENNATQQILKRFHLEHLAQYRAVSSAIFKQLIQNDEAAGLMFDNEHGEVLRSIDAPGTLVPLKEKVYFYRCSIFSKNNVSPALLEQVSDVLKAL